MAYDFKKEFRDLYQPKAAPALVDVPAMTFAAVAGAGDPNEEGGAYRQALELLYAFSYTVKMSKMGAWQPEGYFDYVVPPLEGLWWGDGGAFDGTGIADKAALSWVSLIRQPDFVSAGTLPRIHEMAAGEKPALADALESGELRLVRFSEGCVQAMHRPLRRGGGHDLEARGVRRCAGPSSRHRGGGGRAAGRHPRHARLRRRHALHPPPSRDIPGRPQAHEAREPQTVIRHPVA